VRRLFLTIPVGVVLVGVGLLITASPTDHGTYSVQQLAQEMRLNPHAWVGRTVRVRAVVRTLWWGSGHGVVGGHQAFLLDAPASAPIVSFPYFGYYGARLAQLNSAGATASVLLAGPMPQPSASKRLLIMLAHLPMISHLFAVSPNSTSDIYHIQIVSTEPCPPAFGGFCPIGTRVS
jgi:hypothetical protein